jgi:DNA ligase D-like protein (predicted 3'-phosphoesterase)
MTAMAKSRRTYEQKRNKGKTPEPFGGERPIEARPMFVIQKHDASSLHFDLRLEIGGALKSWAVPKGPSLDPREKRLAIETEDHPIAYGGFEGVIPEGQYGAGTVMIFDIGPMKNVKDASLEDQYADGQIEVELCGGRIKGKYALIRTGKKDSDDWLLIKMKDDAADARRKPTRVENRSATSGRTMHEIRKAAADG